MKRSRHTRCHQSLSAEAIYNRLSAEDLCGEVARVEYPSNVDINSRDIRLDPFDLFGGRMREVRALKNSSIGENIIDPLDILEGLFEQMDLIFPLCDICLVEEC